MICIFHEKLIENKGHKSVSCFEFDMQPIKPTHGLHQAAAKWNNIAEEELHWTLLTDTIDKIYSTFQNKVSLWWKLETVSKSFDTRWHNLKRHSSKGRTCTRRCQYLANITPMSSRQHDSVPNPSELPT